MLRCSKKGSVSTHAWLRSRRDEPGADETMTEYGFAGRRHSQISQFGGFWPNNTALASIFPWYSFMGGTQQNYLAKDEYVTGSYGVEGRFPFLDPAVVQARPLHSCRPFRHSQFEPSCSPGFGRRRYPLLPISRMSITRPQSSSFSAGTTIHTSPVLRHRDRLLARALAVRNWGSACSPARRILRARPKLQQR